MQTSRLQDAEEQRKRYEIKMIQDRHQANPFDDGGATLELLTQNTSSAAELMQFAIQSQYPSYPYDGSDLASPPPPQVQPPPPALFDFKGQTPDENWVR